jgi:hypothetical protein
VIASLTSDSDIVQKIKDQLIEKGRNMTTINMAMSSLSMEF